MSRSSPTKVRFQREHSNVNSLLDSHGRDSGGCGYSTRGQTMEVSAQNLVYHNSTVAVINKGLTTDARQNEISKRTDQASYTRNTNINNPIGIQKTTSAESNSDRNKTVTAINHVDFSEFLCSLWQNQKMCDIIIRVDGKEYKAHKLALAARSDKFSSTYCERLPLTYSKVNLTESSAKGVEDILRFLYTSELKLDSDNIDAVTGCAQQLGITSAMELIKQYLLKYDSQTIFKMWHIAEKYGIIDVLSRLEIFISEKFPDVYKSSVFLNEEFEHVLYFVSKGNFNVHSELDMFLATASWINFNRTERLRYAPQLMSCIRFVKISPDELSTVVEKYDNIFRIKECREMLFDAYRYHALHRNGKRPSENSKGTNSRLRTRSADTFEYSMGDARQKTLSVSAESVHESYPTEITSKKKSGKTPDLTASPNARKYNKEPTTVTHEVRSHSPKYQSPTITHEARRSHSPKYQSPTVTHEVRSSHSPYNESPFKHIFMESELSDHALLPTPPRPTTIIAVGGVDPSSIDSNANCRMVEEYNPTTDNWRKLTVLPESRHHMGAAMLGGFLYVIGGSNLNVDDPEILANPTDICFKFDSRTYTWSRIAPLRQPRIYLSVCVLDGVLYALGGSDSYGRSLDTVEYYDPYADAWGLSAPMLEAKISTAAVGYKGLLFVTGGLQEFNKRKSVLNTVECYDPNTNSWMKRNPLPIPCCHANLVEAKGNLYLLGGSIITRQSTSGSLDTVFRYSEIDDCWHHLLNMRIGRHDAGATVIGSRIYIVGGVSSEEERVHHEMECLDVDFNTWIEGLASLSRGALGIACCSFEDGNSA